MDNCCVMGLDSLHEEAHGCVLTIGNFDSVHLGHQRILMNCRMLARQERAKVVVLTFVPLPEFVLRPHSAPPNIMPPEVNCELLLKAGADLVITEQIDAAFLAMTPEQFVDEIIMKRFAPKHIVEGQDFFFGRSRMGNIKTLDQFGMHRGFVTHVVEPVTLMFRGGQRRVSSTLIRELILAGEIDGANDCLGRKFTMHGCVVHGLGKGREIDFPTVNLDCTGQICPGDGVYAGKARIGEREYVSAISIGTRPTLRPGSRERAVEAFLIDASGDFYGSDMTLELHKRLRKQQKFANMEELKRQIADDVEQVRQMVR